MVCAATASLLVQVMPNLFAMIVVVAFSSCLDVAAIEMEMGSPLDFNGELQTVRDAVGPRLGWRAYWFGLFVSAGKSEKSAFSSGSVAR